MGALRASAEEWDSHTSIELFASCLVDRDADWDDDAPDGVNEIVFEYCPEPNVIAVTIIWGYFSGRDKRSSSSPFSSARYYA